MDQLKSFGRKLGRGALLAVGLPYGLVILTNVLYGWPCSKEGEDKYKRALHPNRVLKVTYAIVEQVDLLKILPVYMKWTSLYKTADNLVKDIQYGTNKNMLDVWLPQKLASECNTATYDRLQSSSDSSSAYQHPVVVFVYGGAWGSGDKNMYGLLAQKLIQYLGVVVVVPNYSIFPKGEVKDMVQDVHDTLTFIRSSEFSQLAPYADQQNVILFGHSAGAHLCALSVIDLADRLKEQRESAKSDYDPGMSSEGPDDELEDSGREHGDLIRENALLFELEQEKISPRNVTGSNSGLPNNAEELLSSVSGVVGLGGVYHIMDHYHHESWRGVEDLSPMWRVMNGLDRFDSFSPTERVLRMSPEQTNRLPPMFLIHGTEDKVVPPSSSEKFATALADREGAVTIKMIAEGGHAQLIIDLMDDKRKFHHTMVGLLKEAKTKVCTGTV